MTVILAEVYDALRSIPGMDEGKARRAAEALGASEAGRRLRTTGSTASKRG